VHVLEYLWKVAYTLHPEAAEEWEGWVLDRVEDILKLRSLRICGDQEPYLAFHFEEEQRRQLPEPADARGKGRGGMKVGTANSDRTLPIPALSYGFWGTRRRFKGAACTRNLDGPTDSFNHCNRIDTLFPVDGCLD
jgi:hypothetical protein